MPCCKAEEFGGWCEGEPTVWHGGMEYCIFHAPKECVDKPKTIAFNEAVLGLIERAENENILCDLSGAIFAGLFDLRKLNKIHDITFEKAIFHGDVYFTNVKFDGVANFVGAIFLKTVSFWGTTFEDEVAFAGSKFYWLTNFSGAKFNKEVIFWCATFYEHVVFKNTLFNYSTDFRESKFHHDVDFMRSNFTGITNFNNALFSGDVSFWNALFAGITSFMNTQFMGKIYFLGTKFTKDVTFLGVNFNDLVDFKNSNFTGQTNFSLIKVSESINFNSTYFMQPVYFLESQLKDANFSRTYFQKLALFRRTGLVGANFQDCSINDVIEFDQADITKVNLLQTLLDSFHFIDCIWPKYKSVNTVYDARKVGDKGYLTLDGIEKPDALDETPAPGKLQDIFRKLKKKAKEEHDESLAGDWHYWEKYMQRRACWQGVENSKPWQRVWWSNLGMWMLLSVYNVICGYGERPGRAGLALLVLFAIPALGYMLFNIPQHPGLYIPLVKSSPVAESGFGFAFLQGLYRALMTLQAGLLALAIRNKMRR